MQDEASTSIAMALLYHGGFHALQLQRVAHYMWESGNITSALRIQVPAHDTCTAESACHKCPAPYALHHMPATPGGGGLWSSCGSAWAACIAVQRLVELQRPAPDTFFARLQSLTSRALGADLHPAAHFGKGVFIAHPLGVSLPVRALLFC